MAGFFCDPEIICSFLLKKLFIGKHPVFIKKYIKPYTLA